MKRNDDFLSGNKVYHWYTGDSALVTEGPMKPDLEMTSVPTWATATLQPEADLTGRYWAVVTLGHEAEPIVANWTAQIRAQHPDAVITVHVFDADEDEAAAVALSGELADAVVGWRLMIAGPADTCLRLRAKVLTLGIADDEIRVASTTVDRREVLCVHCGAHNRAAVEIEGVVSCTGCSRDLLVYYHVSRLKGAHLGFMVDAEQVAT